MSSLFYIQTSHAHNIPLYPQIYASYIYPTEGVIESWKREHIQAVKGEQGQVHTGPLHRETGEGSGSNYRKGSAPTQFPVSPARSSVLLFDRRGSNVHSIMDRRSSNVVARIERRSPNISDRRYSNTMVTNMSRPPKLGCIGKSVSLNPGAWTGDEVETDYTFIPRNLSQKPE